MDRKKLIVAIVAVWIVAGMGAMLLAGLGVVWWAKSLPPVEVKAATTKVEASKQVDTPKQQEPIKGNELAINVFTAKQVWNEYRNVLHAGKMFHNKQWKYLIIGVVQSVDSVWGSPEVVISGDDLGLERMTVSLPASFMNEASKLQPHTTITFFGSIHGSGQWDIRMDATEMGPSASFQGRLKPKQ